jgi:hypothetical protein
MLFLLNFISQSFYLRLMQIFELILILAMLSGQIVLNVFVLSFEQVDLMEFLLLKLLQLVFAVSRLNRFEFTYDFSYSFFKRIWRVKFYI